MNIRARLTTLVEWIVLGSLVGVVCGVSSGIFLWLLDRATNFRTSHEHLVYFLPIAGLVLGWAYERFGASIAGGNNLVIDRLHDLRDDSPPIPLRMVPMVLFGTLATHLFGGSAGREGTAVQMGASLSDFLARSLRATSSLRRQLLVAGVAGGFGSVFGTPIAGALFGLEFLWVGRIQYAAMIPALVASVVGDMTTRAMGIGHSHYPVAPSFMITPLVLLKWMLFAAIVAMVTAAFIELTHGIKRLSEKIFRRLPLRMCAGGLVLVLLWKLTQTNAYIGLGLPLLQEAFENPKIALYVFALKLVFTAVTLGSGYLGGEVTPLFVIGATLGAVLARWLGLPLILGAGVGLAAVFAASANTPIALSIMAVELFGANILPHVMIVSVVAYVLTGHRSIYNAQRIDVSKGGVTLDKTHILRDKNSDTPQSKPPPAR